MLSSCGQFLCAALLLSALCQATAVDVKTDQHLGLCMNTNGTAQDEEGTDTNWVVQSEDLARLSLVDCPHGKKCFECTRDDHGMTYYAAHCATKVEDAPDVTCSNSGLTPCKSVKDGSCYPELEKTRAMQDCRFLHSEDERIVVGGYHVRCKSTCSSAVFYYENHAYKCKGCTTYCQNWLDKKRSSAPSGESKFCENERDCELPNKSDEAKGSGRSSLSSVAAALTVAGVLSIGLGF